MACINNDATEVIESLLHDLILSIDNQETTRDATEVIEFLLHDVILSIDNGETTGVEVWIEDREGVRGPISMNIRRGANLAELREQAEISFGIPIQLQKWIVGQTLCSDDNTSIESLAGPDLHTPFYLFFVEADVNKDTNKVSAVQHTTDQKETTATNENVYICTNNINRVEVWIEDGEAVRGPISFNIRRGANLAELRKQAEISFGIPIQLQKWIVGRTLCSDDNTSIESLAGPDLHTPFYLFFVEADVNKDATTVSTVLQTTDQIVTTAINRRNVYNELKLLDNYCALVPNKEQFECGVCIVEYSAGEGVVLKECVHTFCRECLSAAVKHCEDPEVACPAAGCTGNLQEREIRALVSSEEYERWLARGLAAAESASRNSFHCRTPDCTGWALCEPGVRVFPCPVCQYMNCVPCQAMHEGMTCDQHRVNTAIDLIDDNGTKAHLNELLQRGEALPCPECDTIIIKTMGCDFLLCSACKTEICWVTRGRRWGPGGHGDTSGGCRCGVDGKRCHPACGNCH